jgi:hypothetical protein
MMIRWFWPIEVFWWLQQQSPSPISALYSPPVHWNLFPFSNFNCHCKRNTSIRYSVVLKHRIQNLTIPYFYWSYCNLEYGYSIDTCSGPIAAIVVLQCCAYSIVEFEQIAIVPRYAISCKTLSNSGYNNSAIALLHSRILTGYISK